MQKLCVDHLGGAAAGTFKLAALKVFCQGRFVPGGKGYDAHKISSFHRKS